MKIICCNNNAHNQLDGTTTTICNRHVLVFGEKIQEIISDLTIGVVSVGGIGSLILEQIMRLFPKKVIFIDNDIVEMTNLNRLVGADIIDAETKLKKVDLVKRNILNFNKNQNLEAIFGNFLEKENQEKFKECDIIFGASDSNAARIATNRLCLAHGILYLDCGVGAFVKNNHLKAAGGQIIIIKPESGFCLHCSNLFDVRQAMTEFLSNGEKIRQENQGYIRGENVKTPQVYSLNMMVASWAIWIFQRFVSGDNIEFDGLAIDAKYFRTYFWKEENKEYNDCPTCGIEGIVFKGDDVDLLTLENDDEISILPEESIDIETVENELKINDTNKKNKEDIFIMDIYPRLILGAEYKYPNILNIFDYM